MMVAIASGIQPAPLSFDGFFTRCGGDSCYTLIDREVFDLELNRPHKEVAAFIRLRSALNLLQRFRLSELLAEKCLGEELDYSLVYLKVSLPDGV